MKPLVLCVVDKINLEELNSYSKVTLNPTDNIYADIGIGKKVLTPTDIINKELEDASFYYNINLINAINNTKGNKAKVHIIGNFDEDRNILDGIIKVSKDLAIKNVYLHLFSSKKINVKSIIKEYGITKVANTFDIKIANDSKRVYEAIVKNKKMETATDLNSAHISSNDTIIFYNIDLSMFSEVIESLTAKTFTTFERRDLKNLNILSIFKYSKVDSMYNFDKVYSLSKYISDNNLKQLRVNFDNYSFDGYSYTPIKGAKNSNDNILDIDISKYDFVAAKVTNKELKKLENIVSNLGGTLLIVSSNENTILASKNIILNKGNTYSIFSTVIDLLGLKKIKGYSKSLVGIKENLSEFIFRSVSIIFVIACVVIYMARFLHFYLTK